MADDVNKAGKSVNGRQIPKPLQEAFDERSRRISHEHLSNDDRYTAMMEKEEKVNGVMADITKMINAGSADSSALVEQMQNAALLRDQIVNSMDTFEGNNASKQNSILADRIKTYTNSRNVNQRTTTMAGEQRYFRMARESQDLYAPTDVLEKRIAASSKELTGLGGELSGRVRGIGSEEMPDSLMDKAGRIQELQEEIALNKRLLKVQVKEGLSTEKRQYSAQDTVSRASSVLGQAALRDEVASGRYGTTAEETGKLADMFGKLTEALEKFEEVSERATDAQGNLTEEYKQASATLDKMQKDTEKQRKIVAEVERQGGGGGGGLQNVRNALPGFQAMVDNAYGMDIDDKITEMRLKAGMGQTAVDQYNRVNAGIGGDMRSLLRESTSQDFIKSFSDDMRQKAIRQGSINAVTGAAGGIIDGLGAMSEGSPIAGGATMGGGIMRGIRGGMAVYRGLPQTAKALDAYQAGEQFSSVGLEIQAQGLQAVYDQQMGAYQASIGRGQTGLATEATLMDTHSLSDFAKQGMTPAQAANLTAMAGSAIGGTGSATGTALAASRAQQSRIMSADQFIGMTGQLANAGGSASDLEEIMRNAVAAGMDNAKNVQQMVSATVALSSNLAKSGLQGAAGSASNVVGSLIQSLGGDKNTAALAAESMVNIRANLDSDRGLNIGNVYEDQQLRKLDPRLSTVQKETIAGLSQAEFNNLLTGGREAAEKMGLGSAYDRSGGGAGWSQFVDRAAGISTAATRVNLGGGIWTGKGDVTGENGLSEDMIGLGYQRGLSKEALMSKGTNMPNKADINPARSAANDIIEAQAGRKVQEISWGAGDDMNVTLKQIAATMQDLAKVLTPQAAQGRVESSMDSMKAVGSLDKAGDKFSDATANFAKGVEKFNDILRRTDMAEHRTKPNLINNSDNSQKVNGNRR